MAQDSGFFNAEYQDGEYDRVYNAEQFAAYFAAFISNGIFGGTMEELLPTAANPNNMSINVLSGRAWINGWWYLNDETYNMPIALADGVLSRKDIVVVRWGNAERRVWLEVIQGEPSLEAVAPTIRRDADYYDLKLCEIDIPAGTSKITQAQITDTRLVNSVCGLVTGLIDQIDTTSLFIQFQAAYAEWKNIQEADFEDWSEEQKEDFDSWYDAIKDVISESTAYNIFGMITENVEVQTQVSKTYAADDLVIYQEELREVTSTVPQGSELNNNNSHKIALSTLINRIYTSFSNALTSLKNTAIAQAVGATGSTFTSVIAKLAEIVNRGSVSKTLDVSTTSFIIAQGYHDGTGSVNIVTQEKSVAPTVSSQDITPDSGKVLSKVVVNAVSTQEKTATPSTSVVTVTPDSGKLLSKVVVTAMPLPDVVAKWSDNILNIVEGSLGSRGSCTDGVIRSVFEIPQGKYYGGRSARDLIGVTDDKIRQLGWRMENVNSDTYSVTSNGTKDMGYNNTYRYVNASPYAGYRVISHYGQNGICISFGNSYINGILSQTPYTISDTADGGAFSQVLMDGLILNGTRSGTSLTNVTFVNSKSDIKFLVRCARLYANSSNILTFSNYLSKLISANSTSASSDLTYFFPQSTYQYVIWAFLIVGTTDTTFYN